MHRESEYLGTAEGVRANEKKKRRLDSITSSRTEVWIIADSVDATRTASSNGEGVKVSERLASDKMRLAEMVKC
jgi:hypothetical protein